MISKYILYSEFKEANTLDKVVVLWTAIHRKTSKRKHKEKVEEKVV